MKLKILLLAVASGLISCEKKIELNKYDFNSVKNYTLHAIKENDSMAFMKLFDLSSREFKESNFGPNSDQLKKLTLSNFKVAFKTFDNSDFQFLKYDFSDALNGGQLIDDSSLMIYVKSQGKYFRLRFPTYNNNTTDATSLIAFYFENLSSECEEFSSKAYVPTMLLKKELIWNNSDDYKFDFVALRLNNLTPYEIDKIKYRVSIIRISDNALIVRKTMESDINIQKGDVGSMPIHGLKNISLGEKLKNTNFGWSVDILDVVPKPLKNPCQKLQILTELK